MKVLTIELVFRARRFFTSAISKLLIATAMKEAHARAYATALAALTAGLPVRIYSYVGSACDRAAYIEIRR